ncbi:hypothetical protein [Roseovarius sp. MMSF_3281]|uniref:hypothetical protein n=1 Tax=Roseovarius sp. MMSF_3281 TaxID=3046694 RepID=UPI00273EEA3B|nr:hypothetical protein [Roseovarius sp. MMSF_3281]
MLVFFRSHRLHFALMSAMGRQEKCATVSEALDNIGSLAELEGFTDHIRNPIAGMDVKQPTKSEWQRIAQMKLRFQQEGKR